MKKEGAAIYWLIFLGMVVGIAIGAIAIQIGAEQFVKDWITPIGDIFVRILNLITVPLLFVSLVKGIINLDSTTKLMSLGWRTILIYTATTAVATLFAIAVVMLVQPGGYIPEATSAQYFGEFASHAGSTIDSATAIADQSPLAPFVEMIPSNIITALSASGGMLQTLVLAIMIGVAMVTIKGTKLQSLRDLILDFDAMLSHAINAVMYIVPLGIMALMANVVIDSNGDLALLQALGYYSLTTILAILAFAFGFYPLIIKLFTKIKVRDYITAVIPIQLMAISTSSSAATLPTTMKVANDQLAISQRISSFTLPMGVTFNMDGSSIYLSITVIFIAQVMGIDLTMLQILTIVFTSIIASIGTPGIPGGVLVTIVMVLNSIGIPVESVAIVIALVRPIDMFVTALNVTGDVAVTAVVAQSVGDVD